MNVLYPNLSYSEVCNKGTALCLLVDSCPRKCLYSSQHGQMVWAAKWCKIGLVARKSNFIADKQQRHRPTCTCAQSGQ